jgi:hypothetical protein
MTQAEVQSPDGRLWPRSTSILLIVVGVILSMVSLAVVYAMGPLPWHGARDAELRATFSTYMETGVLLIKPTGSGSYGVQAPTPGPLAAAAWDDDPGAYIVASLLGPVTERLVGTASPYPGLMLVEGLLVSLPLLWLPTAVARVFRSPRAGYALIALPPVLWLCNHGAVLLGTEYGLSDEVSTLRVYALYGIAASLAFLSLSLILLFSTFKLRLGALVGATLLIGTLAGFGNLFRSLSGFGVALCVGVLWWLNSSKKWRWPSAVLATGAAVVLAVLVQNGVMAAINTTRVEATGQTIQELPDAHAVWHSMYMGLSYPQPLNGTPSAFGVTWSDEYGWAKAREVDPDVVVASEHYDEILKDLYWQEVSADPWGAVKLYVKKFFFVTWHFAAMLAVIIAGFVVALIKRGPHRKAVIVGLLIGLPTLALGLVPPVLVMPMLYYYSELAAVLGVFLAIAMGALVWYLSPHVIRLFTRTRSSGESSSPSMETADSEPEPGAREVTGKGLDR